MRRLWVLIVMLAGAALACNLGAEPAVPTIVPNPATATILVFFPTPDQATDTPEPVVFPTLPPVIVPCSYPTGWVQYVVQRGDTLGDLAQRSATSIDNLVNGNCLNNANLITVGQVLFLPNAPIPPTATHGGPVSQTIVLSVQPASYSNGSFRVTPGRITLYADGVISGIKVTFFYGYAGGQPSYLGESPIFSGRAQLVWDVTNMPQAAAVYVTAIALNSDGQYVQYSNQIIIIRYDSPLLFTPTPSLIAPTVSPTPNTNPPVLGALSISPAQLISDPTRRYRVRPGQVFINLSSAQNAVSVVFRLQPSQTNAEPITVAVINSVPPGFIDAVWNVQCPTAFAGKLYATAANAGGQVATSDMLDVFCDPNLP